MFDGPEGLSAFQTIEAGLKSGFWDPKFLNITNEHEAYVEFAKGNMATVMHSESEIHPTEKELIAAGKLAGPPVPGHRVGDDGLRPGRRRHRRQQVDQAARSVVELLQPAVHAGHRAGDQPARAGALPADPQLGPGRPRGHRGPVPHPGPHGAGQGRHQPVVDAVQLRAGLRRRRQQDDQGRVLRPAGPRRRRQGRQRRDHQVPERLAVSHAAGTAGKRAKSAQGEDDLPPCAHVQGVVIVRHAGRRLSRASRGPANPISSADADRRLAAGEITPDEHRDLVARVHLDRPQGTGAVRPRDAHRRRRRRRGPAAAAGRGTRRDEHGPGRRSCPTGPRSHAPIFDRGPDLARADHASTPGAGRTAPATSWSSRSSSGRTRMARLADPGGASREVLALGLAEALNAELLALAAAGCPIIQIDEGALTTIGDDEAEWQLYAETQRRLTAGLDGPPPEPRALPRRHPPGRSRDRPRRPVPQLPGRRVRRARRLALRVRGPAGDRRHRRRPRRRRARSSTRPR